MIDFTFKKFENVNKKTEDVITITKSGYIGFPKFFYTKHGLSNYTHAILFFDETMKVLAIKFTKDELENSKIKILPPSKEGYGASIIGKSFFKHYNLDPNLYHGKYKYDKQNREDIGEVFILKLKEKQGVPTQALNL